MKPEATLSFPVDLTEFTVARLELTAVDRVEAREEPDAACVCVRAWGYGRACEMWQESTYLRSL